MSKSIRYTMIGTWGCLVAAGISAYLISPSSFSAQNIAAFLDSYGSHIWIAYFLMSALRGLTLLPSTPLVVAGTLLFPERPLSVLAISLTGIAMSSTMLYFFSERLGFNHYFESHKPELVARLRSKLESPLVAVFVALWAFFPLVPTDLVCYLAGTIRMNFARFIAAVLMGELILCVCYIYFGGSLIKFVS